MIEHALHNAPDASFIVGDARFFKVDEPFHYVISAGDSLNHILTLDELKDTFHHVYLALYDGGTFAFDMNMEKGFLENGLLHFIFQRKNMYVRLILHMITKIKKQK